MTDLAFILDFVLWFGSMEIAMAVILYTSSGKLRVKDLSFNSEPFVSKIMSIVALSKGDVVVEVQTKPLTINIHKRKSLLQRVSSEAECEYNGVARSFFDAETVKKEAETITLRCIGPGVVAFLKLSLKGSVLGVTWESESGLIEAISDTWIAPEKTHWYGQGQLQHQAFPLHNHVSEMKPFLAENIQVPFWLAGNGVGVLVDNYQVFETRFDRGITIKPIDFRSFTYKILIGKGILDARGIFLRNVGLPERVPDRRVLVKPIFTTWVEYKKEVDQAKVIEFASNIKKRDFPCSVIQIDDKWEKSYGDFTFDLEKFPDPKKMVETIHNMGYLATLWVYPFINHESQNFDYAKSKGFLALDPEKDEPANVRWWDGEAGLLDISNPEARTWYNEKLQALKKAYGFDGFKFDAGDGHFFPIARSQPTHFFLVARINRPVKLGRTQGSQTPNQYTDEWLRFIAENQYNLAEARVGYLCQKFGVIAREGDKESTWGLDNGLHAAITQALTLSLTGYLYIMPDMIGGNQYRRKCDRELFIRWAEAMAFMPIVEYSITPWTYDEETTQIAKRHSLLHLAIGDYYMALAENAKKKGEPIPCPLVLRYPKDKDSVCVNDEYLVGDLLVAPVIVKGSEERTVHVPGGTWLDLWSNQEIRGPKEVSATAPLDRLPLYIDTRNRELALTMRKARKEFF